MEGNGIPGTACVRALRLDKGTQIERMNRRQKYRGYSVVQGEDSQKGKQIIRVLGETVQCLLMFLWVVGSGERGSWGGRSSVDRPWREARVCILASPFIGCLCLEQ